MISDAVKKMAMATDDAILSADKLSTAISAANKRTDEWVRRSGVSLDHQRKINDAIKEHGGILGKSVVQVQDWTKSIQKANETMSHGGKLSGSLLVAIGAVMSAASQLPAVVKSTYDLLISDVNDYYDTVRMQSRGTTAMTLSTKDYIAAADEAVRVSAKVASTYGLQSEAAAKLTFLIQEQMRRTNQAADESNVLAFTDTVLRLGRVAGLTADEIGQAVDQLGRGAGFGSDAIISAMEQAQRVAAKYGADAKQSLAEVNKYSDFIAGLGPEKAKKFSDQIMDAAGLMYAAGVSFDKVQKEQKGGTDGIKQAALISQFTGRNINEVMANSMKARMGDKDASVYMMEAMADMNRKTGVGGGVGPSDINAGNAQGMYVSEAISAIVGGDSVSAATEREGQLKKIYEAQRDAALRPDGVPAGGPAPGSADDVLITLKERQYQATAVLVDAEVRLAKELGISMEAVTRFGNVANAVAGELEKKLGQASAVGSGVAGIAATLAGGAIGSAIAPNAIRAVKGVWNFGRRAVGQLINPRAPSAIPAGPNAGNATATAAKGATAAGNAATTAATNATRTGTIAAARMAIAERGLLGAARLAGGAVLRGGMALAGGTVGLAGTAAVYGATRLGHGISDTYAGFQANGKSSTADAEESMKLRDANAARFRDITQALRDGGATPEWKKSVASEIQRSVSAQKEAGFFGEGRTQRNQAHSDNAMELSRLLSAAEAPSNTMERREGEANTINNTMVRRDVSLPASTSDKRSDDRVKEERLHTTLNDKLRDQLGKIAERQQSTMEHQLSVTKELVAATKTAEVSSMWLQFTN